MVTCSYRDDGVWLRVVIGMMGMVTCSYRDDTTLPFVALQVVYWLRVVIGMMVHG